MRTAICGSDLHLYDGFIPTMEAQTLFGYSHMMGGYMPVVKLSMLGLPAIDSLWIEFRKDFVQPEFEWAFWTSWPRMADGS